MKFVVVGEGNSDVGSSDANPGPLMAALRRLAEAFAPGEPFESRILSRGDLAALPRTRAARALRQRGAKRTEPGMLTVEEQAGRLAAVAAGEAAGSVFFHDCDFTRSDTGGGDTRYRALVCAVERGFASVSSGVPPKPYAYGVPMIPMPRSEAWLLCHYREPRYRNGPAYERLPGNDSSPKSAKKLLARCLGCRVNEIYCHVDGEEIDWMRVDAPSFDFFRRRYRHVLEKLTGQSTTLTEPETLMSEAP